MVPVLEILPLVSESELPVEEAVVTTLVVDVAVGMNCRYEVVGMSEAALPSSSDDG